MNVYEICFSPTGGTQRVADLLAKELAEEIQRIDLTDSGKDFSGVGLQPEDVAILAVPSYGGRVPAPAIQRICAIKGNSARAVLVCVYGNRAYEDTLVELQDAAEHAGFRTIAAVAAIAEHSIARQYAAGRPDAVDQSQLADFAHRIHEKLLAQSNAEPSIPGNRPYKNKGGSSLIPKPNDDCTSCGLCAEKCPVQAIDRKNPAVVNDSACIACMRCVALCPHAARTVNPAALAAVDAMLKKVCSDRKEPELFL